MGAAMMDDALLRDALHDAFGGYHMGITAENIAEEWGLTRQQLDEFAAWSQNKCEKARAEGKFKDEIVPVEVKKKKETILFDTDEGPRDGVTVESLSMLPISFFACSRSSSDSSSFARIPTYSMVSSEMIFAININQTFLNYPFRQWQSIPFRHRHRALQAPSLHDGAAFHITG